MITLWFTGAERGLAMSTYSTGLILGSLFTLSVTNGLLMPYFDGNWRAVIMAYAAVILIAMLAWLIIANRQTYRAAERQLAAEPREPRLRAFVDLLSVVMR